MKISVDIDCTPEEARRFMGLPDLTPIHEAYLAKTSSMIDDGVTPETVERMLRAWSPLGDAGMAAWQRLFEQITPKPK